MRKAILVAILLLPLAVGAQEPEPVVEQPGVKQVEVVNFPETQNVTGTVSVANLPAGSTRFQFVGVTAATFTGNKGVGTFTLACQQEYPGSRMCTSQEILWTTDWPPQPAVPFVAWVHPTFVATSASSVDVSGLDGHLPTFPDLTCGGWAALNLRGLAVNSDPSTGKYGTFSIEPCNTAASIACCVPVE